MAFILIKAEGPSQTNQSAVNRVLNVSGGSGGDIDIYILKKYADMYNMGPLTFSFVFFLGA